MYRVVLGVLVALAIMDMAAACPPAKSRVVVVDGKEVVEWYCEPKQVMYQHEGQYLCFPTCPSCLNGFCDGDKCHCFPGTREERPGVCGQICPNCESGWCLSASKCECYEGYTMFKGKCVNSYMHLTSERNEQKVGEKLENPPEKANLRTVTWWPQQ